MKNIDIIPFLHIVAFQYTGDGPTMQNKQSGRINRCQCCIVLKITAVWSIDETYSASGED